MQIKRPPGLARLARRKSRDWKLCATALVAFATGSIITAHLTHGQEVRADSNRVFELMIYHAEPGKVPALESVFRDVSKLQAKHHLTVIGYWVPTEDSGWKDTFIYLVAHPSLDAARQNWAALHADPAFPPYRRAAAPLIEKRNEGYNVTEVYMRPTDYSALK